jgi:hypothetical protein
LKPSEIKRRFYETEIAKYGGVDAAIANYVRDIHEAWQRMENLNENGKTRTSSITYNCLHRFHFGKTTVVITYKKDTDSPRGSLARANITATETSANGNDS